MMIDNGDEALRIWATEYGLPTGGPNAVTPEQQEQFIRDFLNEWAELEFAGPSYIYTTRDRIEAVVTEEGLVRPLLLRRGDAAVGGQVGRAGDQGLHRGPPAAATRP